MDTKLLTRFEQTVRTLTDAELDGAHSLNAKLRLAQDGDIEVCYAPFEYINPLARVVIVGITPGRTQMLNALKEARWQIERSAKPLDVLMAAKKTGAFSGAMRPNLINLLNRIGIQRWLGIQSCDELFDSASHLVQTASVLRNPVFVKGENYNGTPNMTRHPLLRAQLLEYFGEDARALPKALFIPLGGKVAEALHFIAENGLIDRNQILDGLPHPSGANAERIAYFLGNKSRGELSVKTNSEKLDQARDNMTRKVMALI